MKLNFRLISLILALILSLSSFVGCTPADQSEVTEPPVSSSENVTEAPETEAPKSSDYTIVENGTGIFKLVRPAELVTEDMPVRIAVDLRKYIMNQTTVSLDLGDDWIKKGESYNSESFEILIGDTDYPETAVVRDSITYGQYAVRGVGNKIVIFSYTDNGYTRAFTEFQSILKNNTVKNDDGSYTLVIPADSLNILGTSEKMTATLPVFKSGKLSSITDMGDGCYGVIIKETTEEA